jgi:hypothetical protein
LGASTVELVALAFAALTMIAGFLVVAQAFED